MRQKHPSQALTGQREKVNKVSHGRSALADILVRNTTKGTFTARCMPLLASLFTTDRIPSLDVKDRNAVLIPRLQPKMLLVVQKCRRRRLEHKRGDGAPHSVCCWDKKCGLVVVALPRSLQTESTKLKPLPSLESLLTRAYYECYAPVQRKIEQSSTKQSFPCSRQGATLWLGMLWMQMHHVRKAERRVKK